MNPYPKLFTPVTIRGVTLRNRIVSTPNQTRFKGTVEAAYMEAKARGGAGAVILGECPVNEFRVRQAHHYTFLPSNKYNMRFMGETASIIKAHGAVPGLQLYHPGIYSLPHREGASLPPIGPVEFTRDDGVKVIAMDDALIEETIEDYATAAANAVKAGFEWIHIQSGHGWLLNQFLSPRTNQRTDKYGGSFENRMRFPLEVFKRIREKAGWKFIMEIRVSGDEVLPGGLDIDDVAEYVAAAQDWVDVVNVSAGVHEAFDTIYRQFAHSGFTPHGVNRELAETVKKKGTKVLVSAVGGISTPELAEEMLEMGQADIIGMARAILADPDFPNKARAGKAGDIIPCLRCNNCLLGVGNNDTIRCAVNAKTGTELHWQNAPRPEAKRKVVVVGAGPSGMRAAITAAERGHDVTIFEEKDSLGGILNISDFGDPLKEDMNRFKNYLVRKTHEMCEVRAGEKATPEQVKALSPDAVIVAIGGEPIVPDVPGSKGKNVMRGVDAYRDADKTGQRVCIIGGGLVGAETGYFLAAEKGRDVTVVEMRDEIGDPVDWRQTLPLREWISRLNNFTAKTGATLTEITETGAKIRLKDGTEEFIEADTVILSVGFRARTAAAYEFSDTAPHFRVIGDCNQPGRILPATRDGYWAAMDIL